MASERRLHPLSLIFAIQQSVKQFLVPALVALFAARGRDAWEIWGVLVLVPIALSALGRVLSFRYCFETTELVIRSGFVFRRVRHIPYDRVQNIDAVQNVLHRLLGVIEVRVETGGSIGTEAALQVVDREALDEIRARVFAGRAGTSESAEAPAAPRVLLAMSPRDVFLFGLISGRGMIVVGALIGLLYEFGLMDRAGGAFGTSGRGVVRQVARSIFGDLTIPLTQVVLAVVVVGVLLVLFRFASALWTFVTYYGFVVTRHGDDLRCEYGLLTRVTSTIPVRRIQKLTVREGPWHRIGRRVSVGVQTAVDRKMEEGQGSSRSWLAPLVRQSALAPLLEGVVPDMTAELDWQPVHPRGVRRQFVRAMPLVLPAFALLLYAFGWWALGALAFLLGWAYVHAARSVAALRWAVSRETVQFRSGWIWRSRLVAPLAKVQVVSRHESPFDRRHGMASVLVDTAGRAQVGYAIRIPYLPEPVARALGGRLAAAAAQTSFRW